LQTGKNWPIPDIYSDQQLIWCATLKVKVVGRCGLNLTQGALRSVDLQMVTRHFGLGITVLFLQQLRAIPHFE